MGLKNWVCGALWVSIAWSLLTDVSAKQLKAGELFTQSQVAYGRYVVRMRAAKGSGVISNFFTYKNDSHEPSVIWEEIDVEVFGRDNGRRWQSNIITGYDPRQMSVREHGGADFADSYHTLAFEWTPTYVRWLVDGREIRRDTGGQQVDTLTSPASFRFNIWQPNIPSWVGPFDASILPVHMFVNWVEFHRWTGSGFERVWRDDFNSLSGRWVKATHTFNENNADFVPHNVNVKNGYLILSLTRADATGYRGDPPVDGAGPGDTPDAPEPEVPEPQVPLNGALDLLLEED